MVLPVSRINETDPRKQSTASTTETSPPCSLPSTFSRTPNTTRTYRRRTSPLTACGRHPRSCRWAAGSHLSGWHAVHSRCLQSRWMSISSESTSTMELCRCQIATPAPGEVVRWLSFWSVCGIGERRWAILGRSVAWRETRGGLHFCISDK